MKKTASLSVLSAGILWGTMGIFVRSMNQSGLAALEIVAVRIAVGLAAVGLYLLLFHRSLFRVRFRDLWCFAGTGVISLLLFAWCYFTAMNYTSLAVAAVLLYTAPIFVMLLSLLLFREALTIRKLLALLLAFAGCVLVSGLGFGVSVAPKGLLLALGSGFFYALYSIFGRYAINRGYQSWTITFYTFLFCSVGCLFLADWPSIVSVTFQIPGMLPKALLMGLQTAFLPYLLYAYGLQHMESSKASILASVEPVVGTLISVLLFHEPIGFSGITGIVLVLAAIAVLSLPRRNEI